MLKRLREEGFEAEFHSHAAAILTGDFPDALAELEAALLTFSVPVSELVASGGGETRGTQRLRRALAEQGWTKHNFVVQRIVDGREKEATSHEVDHVRRQGEHAIGLEIEWNNKDPFFDRDLENFKRLHADGAISAGVVITRGPGMQAAVRERVITYAVRHGLTSPEALAGHGITRTPRQANEVARRVRGGKAYVDAWVGQFCDDKFGEATTHWRKLQDRVQRGVGNPCPLLLIGLPPSRLTED